MLISETVWFNFSYLPSIYIYFKNPSRALLFAPLVQCSFRALSPKTGRQMGSEGGPRRNPYWSPLEIWGTLRICSGVNSWMRILGGCWVKTAFMIKRSSGYFSVWVRRKEFQFLNSWLTRIAFPSDNSVEKKMFWQKKQNWIFGIMS